MKIFLKILVLTLLCLKVTAKDRKRQSYVCFSPISRYVLGKDIRLSYGIHSRKHDWYIGLATHIDPLQRKFSATDAVTVSNGLPVYWYDYLHLNLGYEKHFFNNEYFSPYLYIDLLAGTMNLNHSFYSPTGLIDSNGNQLQYALAGIDPVTRAKFAQLAIGIGCDLNIAKRFSVTARVGASESMTVEKFYGGQSYFDNQYFLDHFIINYGIGIKYNLNKGKK